MFSNRILTYALTAGIISIVSNIAPVFAKGHEICPNTNAPSLDDFSAVIDTAFERKDTNRTCLSSAIGMGYIYVVHREDKLDDAQYFVSRNGGFVEAVIMQPVCLKGESLQYCSIRYKTDSDADEGVSSDQGHYSTMITPDCALVIQGVSTKQLTAIDTVGKALAKSLKQYRVDHLSKLISKSDSETVTLAEFLGGEQLTLFETLQKADRASQ